MPELFPVLFVCFVFLAEDGLSVECGISESVLQNDKQGQYWFLSRGQGGTCGKSAEIKGKVRGHGSSGERHAGFLFLGEFLGRGRRENNSERGKV